MPGRRMPSLAAASLLLCLPLILASSQTSPQQLVDIRYDSYGGIVQRLHDLAAQHPDLVEVWSAQDRFNVPSPGACHDAAGAETACKQWFVTVANRTGAVRQNRAILKNELEERPQIFFSGNLHGDEDVGPMTLVVFLEHLVKARKAGNNPWINKLVDTRVLVAVPITNPWGCVAKKEEQGPEGSYSCCLQSSAELPS